MAKAHLRAIVPQIQRLFDGGVTTALPDGALLRRYVGSGDEGAFATLVARHGGMVLGVCRGILRDESEADDAFQAVFLVLVRKARSIRVDDSLGGWLHGVAYRVARRRNADRLKRAARERHGLAIFEAEARPDPSTDARVAQLHEEIARLPHPQRRALVLCWLEGRTQVEAAREIGCGEATLRRRLSAARARLRERLRDDDLHASPPLPVVPPRLIEAATRLASAPPRALASAVVREVAVDQLAKVAAGLVLAAFAVAGFAWVLTPRTAPVGPPGPPIPAPSVAPAGPVPVARADDEPDPLGWGDFDVVGQVVDPDGKPVAGALVFRRQFGLRTPERKAATDAQGRFTFSARRKLGPRLDPNAPPAKPVPRTTVTRLPGGATITVTRPDPRDLVPRHTDAEEVKAIKPWLVATAPDYGFGTLSPGDGVTLRLVPDEPINGRLVDRTGRPVAGARVRVRDVFWPRRAGDPLMALMDRRGDGPAPEIPKGEGLDPWLSRVRRAADMNEYLRAQVVLMGLLEFGILGDLPSFYAPLIAATTSDADGRFTIRGIGRERVTELYIDGVPETASTLIAVVTRDLPPLEIPAYMPEEAKRITNPGLGLSLFGRRFEAVLSPGRTIAGLVRDRETGAPLAGVKVIGPAPTRLEYPGFDRFFATTDERGRYRIDGFPAMVGESLKVEAPEDRPYFGREIDLPAEGRGPITLDFPLAKGVWITGRVVDDATGAGLGGESIEYHAFQNNPYLVRDLKDGLSPRFDNNARTNDDGSFRIRGYPGRGIVTGGGGHDHLEGIGAEKIAGLNPDNAFEVFYDPRGFSPYIRNTTIEVNIPEGAKTFSCEIRLKKGASRVVQVVGPDGRPRDQIEASGLQNQVENPIGQVAGSSFSVTNLRPGERRLVVARYVPDKLMGMATVTADGDSPVTLQLRPWANLKGRLVDDRGQPRSRGLEILLDDGKLPIHTVNGRNYDTQHFSIDADGRFHLDGLVPSAKYRLQVLEGGFRILGVVTRDITLEPGETRDLGDLRILPPAGG